MGVLGKKKFDFIEIENILANKILQGEVNDGDFVKILYGEEALKFEVQKHNLIVSKK